MAIRRLRLRRPSGNRIREWLSLTFRGFLADRGLERAAALSFTTLLALVPLLATIAAVYKSFFSQKAGEIVQVVQVVLPYSSDEIQEVLRQFVVSASTMGGIAFVIFVAIIFRLFFTIEATLNEIWGVTERRSTAVRIFSFTMILFWGPVVIGLGVTGSLWLEGQPWAPGPVLLAPVGRIVLPFLGFTMVYWLVPHTRVKWWAAVVGGGVATVGLALLRQGFVGYYEQTFPNLNFIYGSLALAVLFLISMSALWMLVLVGAEGSYVAQNLDALLRDPEEIEEGPHYDRVRTALVLLTETYRRCSPGGEPPSLEELAEALSITHRHARPLVDQLVWARLLAVTGRERELYVPVIDAGRLSLAEAVTRLRGGEPSFPELPAAGISGRLEESLRGAYAASQRALATTFSEILQDEEPGPRRIAAR